MISVRYISGFRCNKYCKFKDLTLSLLTYRANAGRRQVCQSAWKKWGLHIENSSFWTNLTQILLGLLRHVLD